MSREENEKLCNNKTWLLVQWVGSFPQDAYDIINISDIVFDKFLNKSDLEIGSAILVRCGKIKSPATVLQISKNTDFLYSELRRLQQSILSENSINLIESDSEVSPPKSKIKKRKLVEDIKITKYVKNESTQTEDENIMTKLMLENQKLKSELYESNKIIKSMCKDMNAIVQGAQKKIYDQNTDSFKNYPESDKENTPPKKIKKSSSATRILEPLEPMFRSNVPEVIDDDMVLIGSGKTEIPLYMYNQINWLSFTAATRKLLMAVFTRDVLATHSLTGKPSPAFIGSEMPVKMRLDPVKVNDIVEIVSTKCNVSESMVRSAITTKCADENKMFKKRVKNEKNENSE